jgi:hypothetical protein
MTIAQPEITAHAMHKPAVYYQLDQRRHRPRGRHHRKAHQ